MGAHPDDIEFGCGGVLLAEGARGAEVALLVCSCGEAGTNGTPAEREKEAKAAAGLLGASIEFLDFGGDAHLEPRKEHALALARRIRALRPHVLLAPTDTVHQHPDHAVVAQICRDAARLARYGGVAELRDLPSHAVSHAFAYAITPGAEPTDRRAIRVDISAHFDRWVTLMECHASQLRTRRYVELQIARARQLGLESGVEYAMALLPSDSFFVGSLRELPASVRLF